MRTIGSTIVGEAVDTTIFLVVAFWGSTPISVLVGMMLAQYLWKVLYEAILTPLTYLIIKRVKKFEGLDHFDHGVRYIPFSLGVKQKEP